MCFAQRDLKLAQEKMFKWKAIYAETPSLDAYQQRVDWEEEVRRIRQGQDDDAWRAANAKL